MQSLKHVYKILGHLCPWLIVCMYMYVAWHSVPYDKPFALVNAVAAVLFAALYTWRTFWIGINPPDDLPRSIPTGKPATRPTGWLYRIPPTLNHHW